MESKLQEIYRQIRETGVVVGLTGAVGSGSTESAKFLSGKNVDDGVFDVFSELLKNISSHFDGLEIYRLKRMEIFLRKNKWQPFFHLKMSDLLFCILFLGD